MATKKKHTPTTRAVLTLRAAGVTFETHVYAWEAHGGTRLSARELGVGEHAVVKTLVMEDERSRPLIVLMHGDMKVSTKALARQIEAKSVTPCAPETANRHTGYLVGGTSPFGTKRPIPVYMEKTIADLDRVYVNGGSRGLLVSMAPAELVRVLGPTLVGVGLPR